MAYEPQNIFARIIRGEVPCGKVYEDEFALAFHDVKPEAPVHLLVVPKGEYASFDDFAQHAPPSLMQGFFAAVQKVALKLGLSESGYRLITNHGVDAGQSVPHFHVHLVGGTHLGKLVP